MTNVLHFVKDNLTFLIPVSLVLGLINGHFFPLDYSRLICASALLVMILPVFVNLNIVQGIKELPQHKEILISASILNFILYPLVAFGLGWFFLYDHPALWFGLILLAMVPTSGMSINWTYYTKGNVALAMGIVSVSIIGTVIILPFAIPYFSELILNTAGLEVSKLSILEKLAFVIIVPAVVGYLIRTFVIRFKGKDTFELMKPINAGISAVGVLLVSFMVMSLKTTQTMLTSNASLVFKALIVLGLFYFVMFVVSHFSSLKVSKPADSTAFFFATVPRYHVITLGVILSTFQDYQFLGGIALTIALGLTIQIPSVAFYARWKEKRLQYTDEQSSAITKFEEINSQEDFVL